MRRRASAVQAVALLLVALGGDVVAARDPVRQAVVASLYGLTLGILLFAFQAPDVALSNIVIGAIALPVMILLAIAKTRQDERSDRRTSAPAGRAQVRAAARSS